MASTGLVAYNPDDPAQAGFLAALAQGETGGNSNSAFTGTGGANLSGLATDQYGFPSWQGLGNSHAAGTFQFQPGTWDSIASQFNLNFQNPQDQAEGAWYLAQQTYAQNNGGASLESALNSGNSSVFAGIQSSLASTWTSVTGNQATQGQGLASTLATFIGNAANAASQNAVAGNEAGSSNNQTSNNQTSTGSGGMLSTLLSPVTSLFVRGGTIAVGVVIVMVAFYALLVQQNIAPSPRQIISKV